MASVSIRSLQVQKYTDECVHLRVLVSVYVCVSGLKFKSGPYFYQGSGGLILNKAAASERPECE